MRRLAVLTTTTCKTNISKINIAPVKVRLPSIQGSLNEIIGIREVPIVCDKLLMGSQWTSLAVQKEVRGVDAKALNGPKILVALCCVIGITESQQAADGNDSVSLQAFAPRGIEEIELYGFNSVTRISQNLHPSVFGTIDPPAWH
jgi:hypothetical protein